MGKSLQKALLVSLLAFAAGVQGVMAQGMGVDKETMCMKQCANTALYFLESSGKARQNMGKGATAAMEDMLKFGEDCVAACVSGVLKFAEMASGGAANSFVSAPAAPAAPQPEPAASPVPRRRSTTHTRKFPNISD
jgi:hypothetical protein